jgi:serine O-acetyltransferase
MGRATIGESDVAGRLGRSALCADLDRRMRLEGRSGWRGRMTALLAAGTLAVLVYRFGRWASDLPCPLPCIPFKIMYFIVFYLIQATTGISVQAYSRIGRGFVILNHTGIFVVAERIGDNFTTCQGVTIGNVRGSRRLPVIGDNVFIEPGAKVLGEITIGDNVVIRANSLVLTDVPSNSIAIGNPARIVPNPAADAES